MFHSVVDIFIELHPVRRKSVRRNYSQRGESWETLDAPNLRACCARGADGGEEEERRKRGERGKEKASEGEGERARYMYTREDGYRVPNRDPRDRVIRIEMNVNPLNTIPGQNTATRGSESGQIRYRGKAGPARARCDPAGCSSLILSLYVLLRRRRRRRRHRRCRHRWHSKHPGAYPRDGS